MATCARTPESKCSMRWLMGWPMPVATPGKAASFSSIIENTCSRGRMSLTAGGLRPAGVVCLSGSFASSLVQKSTSISLALTPSACSSCSARPVRRAVLLTWGIERIISSALVPSLFDSSSDTPGWPKNETTAVPSLKGGRNSEPRRVTTINATATRAPSVPSTATGRGMEIEYDLSASDLQARSNAPSLPCSMRLMPGRR